MNIEEDNAESAKLGKSALRKTHIFYSVTLNFWGKHSLATSAEKKLDGG